MHAIRLMIFLCALMLLGHSSCAEETPPLPLCTTVEQVEARLLFPQQDEDGVNQPTGVKAGYVRYMPQLPNHDALFCTEYWLGGDIGTDLDLTLRKNERGNDYQFYCGNMCTRAVYSMALSYLGVDCTPGDMSRLTGKRDLNNPYTRITNLLGNVEQVTFRSFIFKRMFQHYSQDAAYSPIMLYLRKPDGQCHAVLVVASDGERSYLVVDPSKRRIEEQPVRIYSIAFDVMYKNIVDSTFPETFVGSKLLGLYQWRLIAE